MVRFGVGDDKIVNMLGVYHLLEGMEVKLLEFGMGGVYESIFLPSFDNIGVVGSAVLEAKFNIKTVSIPV